ncbi:MAG: hypothetical protein VB071_04580, partial [Lawsonibacter sp.]|nr:hypothetical protein [Lawsonibacter sp.]
SSNVEGCDVWIYAENAITDDYCYFALSANTQEEVLMDYSNVPGGYGIYRLPCATQEEPMTIDELKMVYPLETNEQLRLFQTSADQTKLLLVTQEENYYILKVLDPKTAQELQRIPLMEDKADLYASELYVGEDFLVALFGETQFVVLSQVGGNYELSFTGTLPEKEIFSFNYSYDYIMAFDGEKLAMAAINDRNTYNTFCGFSLVVCDKTGTLYAGRYDSSLDKAQAAEYIDRCKAMNNDPLKIRWE